MLEEMPVQETIDAAAELQRLKIPVGTIIVNATTPPLLPEGRATKAEVRRGLVAAGLPSDGPLVAGIVAEARTHLARSRVEDELRGELHTLGRPLVELPTIYGGVGLDELYMMAGVLLGDRGGLP